MNKQSLGFMVRVGLGLGFSLGLLALVLWLPHRFSQTMAVALPAVVVDGAIEQIALPMAHTVGVQALASHTLIPLDQDEPPTGAAAATGVGEATTPAQAVPPQLQAWRAWQVLTPATQAKVDSRILAELNGEVVPAHLGGSAAQTIDQPQKGNPLAATRFFVYLHDQPNIDQLGQLVYASQVEQRAALLNTLRATSEVQQAPLRALLDLHVAHDAAVAYQPFFIVNAIVVDGGLDLVVELAQRADVARLVANYPLVGPEIVDTETATAAAIGATTPQADRVADAATAGEVAGGEVTDSSLTAANWNIALVRADRVWNELAVRGAGAVVADFDTGIYFRHPALVNQYRGNLGNNRFDHNYNWFEPDGKLYPNGDLGPSVSDEPWACSSHGTHTMGTMIGDGGSPATEVGMAPAATWIALPGICGNTMSGGLRDDIGGLKAFQWVLCPTDLTGDLASADCSKAPDVVNNSWGSANPAADLFRPIIRTLRAANIAPVFAAGNPYAGDGSIGTPANAPEAITVGATDAFDQIAYFSGRGPSYYVGEQKPELSAPGVSVYSAIGGSGYDSASGTSMAAPHVAGLVALMVSADLQDGVRDLTVDEIETFMIRTAVDLGLDGPDNSFGYGRIDAYAAVNAVLTAGDLQGLIRDATTGAPLAGVHVRGQSGQATFQIETGAQGSYSLTVPAGRYDLIVTAWGYTERRFSGQLVFEGSDSIADFALPPLPVVTVAGTVRAGSDPVADALISVEAFPAMQTQTGATGTYTLPLPVGTHTLVIEKPGYRRQTKVITVAATGTVVGDITVEAAPTILLILADAYRGWFDGWPIDQFFRTALDDHAYLYDAWPIQYLDQEDSFEQEDGSTGYGLPSLTTLEQYDVVIWAQSGCSSGSYGCYFSNGPSVLGVLDALEGYMDGGGRIIFSGQDLGFWEDGGTLFTDYLHTALIDDDIAGEGDGLTGLGFLENIQLTVTNASLYGYRNGIVSLAPDAISAESPLLADGGTDANANGVNVYPILQYDETQLPAAIAVDACTANYRAVYFGVGYENIAQRAEYRSPAITATLGKAVAWVSGDRDPLDLGAVAVKPLRFALPGETAGHELRLLNSGAETIAVDLSASATQWPVVLSVAGTRVVGPLILAPCQALIVDVDVAIPATAVQGARDQFTMTISATPSKDGTAQEGQPVITRAIALTTAAFAEWEAAPSMPTARYQFGVTTLAAQNTSGTATFLYAIGGWRNSLPDDEEAPQRALTENTRYNSCSREWQQMAELPEPRAGMATATVNGQIYIIGGGSQIAEYSFSRIDTHNNVWRYDPAADAWSEVAPLPVPLVGAAAATFNGKIYLFGGMIFGYVIEDFGLGRLTTNLSNQVTYIYDPATDTWSTGAANPGSGHFFGAAARIGNELLVAGGWPDLDTVDLYNPATDSWRAGAPMLQGRHSFGLVVPNANNNIAYAIGGAIEGQGIRTVERFVPSRNVWEILPLLRDDGRYGASAGYVGGRLMAVGGVTAVTTSETLPLADSFCNSAYQAVETLVGIDQPVRYAVELQGDTVDLATASFQHSLPENTQFTRFISNTIGATYDAAAHTVAWRGRVAAGSTLPPVQYEVVATDSLVHATNNARAATEQAVAPGTLLQSTVLFDNGSGLTFTRTASVLFLATDIEGSLKEIDQPATSSGEAVTYTITVLGNNIINRDVSLRDPLPESMTYVPGSLTYPSGRGEYNAATHAIEWAGSTTRDADVVVNLTNNYLWGDSDRPGPRGGVSYEWIEIAETGTLVGSGDWNYYCNLPIGFPFPFYGGEENQFCVSTNGFVSFDFGGHSGDLYNSCPLPSTLDNHSMIAAIWDDLVVEGGIYYQMMGSAPNRHLVVQWSGARRYGSPGSNLATFQVVLFEDGMIRMAIKEVGELTGRSSTTGLEDRTETVGATYGCNEAGILHDEQLIVFVPPNLSIGVAQAEIQFQAIVGSGLEGASGFERNAQVNAQVNRQGDPVIAINQPVTNTAYITLSQKQISRQAITLLNPLDLSSTTFAADRAEVVPNEVAVYSLLLQNGGLITADNATVTFKLPAALTYEADSLLCASGSCQPLGAGTLQWTGVISPQVPLTVTFAARLNQGLRDRTLLTTTATLEDGYGTTYPFVASLLARRSDLSHSQFAFMPRFGEPGYTVALMGILQNVGGLATTGAVTITIPTTLHYVADSLVCGTGTCTITESGAGAEAVYMVQWQGRLGARQVVPIRLSLQIPVEAAYGDEFVATFALKDVDWADLVTEEATLAAMHTVLLPIVAGDVHYTIIYLPFVVQD